MPTTGNRGEDRLIDLFLSVYEHKSWAGDLSCRKSPEREQDSGVELVATQIASGRTLAIEHTIIEPFIGEKKDFFEHFQEFQRRLRTDETLREPGLALYINAPVEVLPKGVEWTPLIDDVLEWLRANKSTFGIEAEIHDCPTAHHPNKTIPLEVRRQPLDQTNESFVIVQRYGEMRIADSVRKALETKLPKLTATDADCRILMLERDQGFVHPETIWREIEACRTMFPALERVHEIWICDTATFGTPREWVEFVRREDGRRTESFAFYKGLLHSMSRNGMPVPLT